VQVVDHVFCLKDGFFPFFLFARSCNLEISCERLFWNLSSLVAVQSDNHCAQACGSISGLVVGMPGMYGTEGLQVEIAWWEEVPLSGLTEYFESQCH
jgi:hypothetical protein